MAITRNSTPPTVALAGNQMWADYSTDETSESFIGLHFQLEVYNGSIFVDFGPEMRYEPDSDGDVLVDIHSLLDWKPEKQYTWPEDPSNVIISRDDLRKAYRIRVYEKYGNPLATQSSNITGTLFALPGKISDVGAGLLNDQSTTWIDELQSKKNFLTNSPRQKTTDPWASERLFFFMSAANPVVNLNVRITYTDSTTKEFTRESKSSVSIYDMLEFVTSFSTLGLFFLDEEKTIEKYQVWLTNGSDEVISEEYTYLVDHEQYDQRKYFLFSNGYRMIEGVRFTGNSLSESQIEDVSQQITLQRGHGAMDRSHIKSFVSESEVREASSGWLTKDEMSWLRELLLSEEVYEIVNGQPIPIRIVTQKVPTGSDDVYLRSLMIEYYYAHKDRVPTIIPERLDAIENFQVSIFNLVAMTNGDSGGYDFASLTYNNTTGSLQVDTEQCTSPFAYSTLIVQPYVPLLAFYSDYSRENEYSIISIILLNIASYTETGKKGLSVSDPSSFGILITEDDSSRYGVKGYGSPGPNEHSLTLKLAVPTKRCLEYFYELQQ